MNWPNPEDRLLAACAQLEFGQAERAVVAELGQANGIRWERIYQTARMHGVVPLVFRNLTDLDPADLSFSNGVGDRFRQGFVDNLVAKRHLREGLWKVLRFFNEKQLDVMLIKGAALDLFGNVYGRYTVSRDVDLIVRAREEDLPDDVLAQILALSDGFPLEYDFHGHHDLDMNGVLPIDWDRVWADAIPVRYAGRDFFIMSPEDALIASCINACRKRYFNLKALGTIDSAVRGDNGLRWSEFVSKSWDYRCNDIVNTALLAGSILMETPVPQTVPDRLNSSGLRAGLMRRLIERLSYSSLGSLNSGIELFGRDVGLGLLLPYVSYRPAQIWRKMRFVTNVSRVNGVHGSAQ